MLSIKNLNHEYNWVNVLTPSETEIASLINDYGVTSEMLGYVLDPDERARVEVDPDANITLIIFDVYYEGNNDNEARTLPVGLMLTKGTLISFMDVHTKFVREMFESQLKKLGSDPVIENQFSLILPLLYRLSVAYFKPIRLADKKRQQIQAELRIKTNRKAINEFMIIETGLVYILTSIKGNVSLLNEIKRHAKELTKDQADLLDDVIVEAQQGMEMATMTSDMTARLSSSYSKVLDMELNNTMRFLTIYSIVLTIPAIVFGFFGQNVQVPFQNSPIGWEITLIIMVVLCLAAGWLLMHNDWWKKR
ncbi:MIT family Mg2+ and Co2+ transporter [Paucilactobacillus oligofermentans DSM 15707 = LMG 22743]|uniref:MIT family Mg2+ and Co2+ transporter n=1 Tax=Paucilactobacillus oligofermentans DSM 15707 = LMG 22743 TaxID=1423778 RepID=A0A0R1REQ9_9LACO|nr:magnesium transporter CorA family protein [Paucilactobacillus oligofermentans]KRL55367.1 MIT family Mg2+ and Co2+ transporter [Paucilactobacillus oligofermentans DSM 15707 = LMG 22743]CUS25642.1 Magnesium transporter CorA [Paucilactobacillus oligofermentans DSM 15707 = LMG 22743]